MPFATLTEMITERKKEHQKGITFILGSTKEIRYSYSELYTISLQLLYHLQNAGFKKGDKVIFQIEDNRLFVFSFWACVLGGMIPVPVTTGATEENCSKIYKIWEILDKPKMIFTDGCLAPLKAYAEKYEKEYLFKEIDFNCFCLNDDFTKEHFGKIEAAKKDDIAFIQFSSGSTGEPKGVILTQSNVITNMNAIKRFSEITSADVSLTWMPLTHDMGLIGGHIKDLLIDIDQYNMETNLFITNPVLWIEKVSEHKASLLYSPNFGYKHFLEYYSENKERALDLSHVRIIYNGAEPISLGLCDNFIGELSKFGLKRTTMQPVYGLAEATVAVSFPHPGDEKIYHSVDRHRLAIGEKVEFIDKSDETAVTFMDVGYPIYDCNMRICDEDDFVLPEDHVGYIEISGDSITKGYFNNETATKELFTRDGWLITGDLGFMHNHRLTITGRAKDVIFVAGQNFYSQDIERVAEEAADDRVSKTAAVGVFNSQTARDELIIFAETKEETDKFAVVAEDIKKAIGEKLSVEASHIIPVMAMPKTESGKLQRFKLAEGFSNGEYDSICEALDKLIEGENAGAKFEAPSTEKEKEIADIWCELLKQNRISINDNFFELGGDSIKITQLVSRINDLYSTNLTITDIYDNQTVKAIAAIINGQSKELAKKEAAATLLKTSVGRIPLTIAQQSLWFIDSMMGESTQYNLYTTLHLYGELDRKSLQKSIDMVVSRHESLRMAIIEENGEAVGEIDNNAKVKLQYIDLTKKEDIELAAKKLEKDIARRPFALTKAPLLRAILAKTAVTEYRLTFVVHHIVFDGWSFSLLMKEIADCYDMLTANTNTELSNIAKDYSDFALWQKEWLKSDAASSQLEYWRKTLSGAAELDFPTDFTRPVSSTYKGKKLTVDVSKSIMPGLKKIGAKANVTLFMILFAAFNILLYKYTGKTDILIGTPIANRNKKDTESIIGLLTNNLVLRMAFSEDDSFEEILETVRDNTLRAYENQDIPFEMIVDELHCERDMSKNPLFQVFFALQNTPEVQMNIGNVKARRCDFDAGTSRFDLSLDITEKKNCVSLCFEYSKDLFEDATVERLAKEYTQLLTKISHSTDFRVKEIDILTTDETALLDSINDTQKDYDPEIAWTALFEKQAKENPDAVAVEAAGKALTYKELNEKTSQLANYLLSLGIDKESVVGVYLDRNTDMLMSLVAVHKAGAAYLPMDPIFPKERLSFMLDDAKAGYIISDSKTAKTLPKNNAEVILIDKINDTVINFDSASPKIGCVGDNLAYLIYTSGSTGKPKGVEIEHHSLSNFLQSMKEITAMKSGDALLAVTTLSFDIAALELYLPLISGAKVVISSREDVVDGEKLSALIKEKNITFLQATPATFRLLLEAGLKDTTDLTVLCGGEAYQRELANKMLECCKRFLNVYGPTETTVWSTLDEIRSDGNKILIGKPIANTSLYVLDNNMMRTPIGVPGELYIGGAGVARGYRNLIELTKEKFIADPFSNCGRMYRTGDIVKITVDGRLQYISRKDNQIKIRGYRIELGEIETLINDAASVKQCVVTDKIINTEKAIVAYIIPKKGRLDTSAIRNLLKEKLPAYMVPSAFVEVESFPMTPNGKIDKRALPEVQVNALTHSNGAFGQTEEVITAVWQSVLANSDFDRFSNFFDVGGNSLLMAQVRNKLQKALKRDISMMELFRYPSIKLLAEFLSGEEEKSEEITQAVSDNNMSKNKSKDIAVIGMSGRFPGAANIDEFWKNLREGKECISHFSDDELRDSGVSEEVFSKNNYVKAWGTINDEYKFDAAFFGYNPTEARIIDPQQRIFLEEAWKALENAGCDTARYKKPVGIFASVGMNSYASQLRAVRQNDGISGDYQIMTGNEKDFLATRTAYKLGFEGPSITVQTACSSSMTAVHLACQSLLNSECDMAFAGGVSVKLPQNQGYLYEEGMILSPDGHCRAFDSKANGTVVGNGAGVVVLKRLNDALCDKDNILAVIKGTGISNDGANKIGYTAPSAAGEAKAERMAIDEAGISPDTVGYIETHGTGTPLGDPIEIEALNSVYSQADDKKAFCAIGSVKTNIGHLDAASGIAGFIKTVLILKNKLIPPSLNFSEPNPKVKLDDSAFYVNTQLKEWHKIDYPLRAAVSSFGIGGTNVHAVLEEAHEKPKARAKEKTKNLFVFSSKDKASLDKLTLDFAMFLKNNADLDPADIAFTLQTGRKEFRFRSFFIVDDITDAINILSDKNEFTNRVHFADINVSKKHETIADPSTYSLEALGNLWLEGAQIAFEKLFEKKKVTKVVLPNYPFKGEIFKVDGAHSVSNKEAVTEGKLTDKDKWFYYPLWQQSGEDAKVAANDDNTLTVIICSDVSACRRFVKRAASLGLDFVTVSDDNNFSEESPFTYRMNTSDALHYKKLFECLNISDYKKLRFISLLGLTGDVKLTSLDAEALGKKLFFTTTELARSVEKAVNKAKVVIKLVTDEAFKIFGETCCPEKALAIGAVKVIPIEYKNISCEMIDVEANLSDRQTDNIIDETFDDSKNGIVAMRFNKRFKQIYLNTQLQKGNKSQISFKDGGVYIITGGLGGIGLNLAQYISKKVSAKLVFVSRSEFPDESLWNEWLVTHEKGDIVSLKIRELIKIKERGCEILVLRADITSVDDMNRLHEHVMAKYGCVNGIICAAGEPGGGMIETKTREIAEKVFSAKVDGTRIVYNAFKETKPEFMILTSSLNAVTGGFGQSDYCSANAYLDNFANAYDSDFMRVISINFDRWPGVGIAADKAKVSPEVNPIIGKKVSEKGDTVIFANTLSPEKDFVLSEHLVMSIPTVAGTTYLEMARAAFADITGKSAVTISNVVFLKPLAVREGEKRRVFTVMTKKNDGFEFTIVSKAVSSNSNDFTEHAKGSISALTEKEPDRCELNDLKNKTDLKTIFDRCSGQVVSEEFISFGGRWRSLEEYRVGKTDGLAHIVLSKEYEIDFKENILLHPAILDSATGALRLTANGNYLPFTYKKLSMFKPLEREVYSHITFDNSDGFATPMIACDVNIFDKTGVLLVKISGFTMKKVERENQLNSQNEKISKDYSMLNGIDNSFLSVGLTTDEGVEVFGKILNDCSRPQIVVSVRNIEEAIKKADYSGLNVAEKLSSVVTLHQRPEIDTAYVAPRSETEKKLCELWQNVLSIEKVGISDEFFDLGGDSLLLINLHTKLCDQFDTDLAIVDLYKYNTVDKLAKKLDKADVDEKEDKFDNVNSRANKQLEMLKKKKLNMQRRK